MISHSKTTPHIVPTSSAHIYVAGIYIQYVSIRALSKYALVLKTWILNQETLYWILK